MTKLLLSIYDEHIEGEVLRKQIIVFLEEKFSIQQQEIIVNENNKSKDQKQRDRPCLVQMVRSVIYAVKNIMYQLQVQKGPN